MNSSSGVSFLGLAVSFRECVHACMCLCLHACMSEFVSAHVCLCSCVCACVHLWVCTCVHLCLCECAHVCLCIPVCLCMCTHECVCVSVIIIAPYVRSLHFFPSNRERATLKYATFEVVFSPCAHSESHREAFRDLGMSCPISPRESSSTRHSQGDGWGDPRRLKPQPVLTQMWTPQESLLCLIKCIASNRCLWEFRKYSLQSI